MCAIFERLLEFFFGFLWPLTGSLNADERSSDQTYKHFWQINFNDFQINAYLIRIAASADLWCAAFALNLLESH